MMRQIWGVKLVQISLKFCSQNFGEAGCIYCCSIEAVAVLVTVFFPFCPQKLFKVKGKMELNDLIRCVGLMVNVVSTLSFLLWGVSLK